MSECIGFFGKLFGHRYQVCVSTREHERGGNLTVERGDADAVRNLMTLRDTEYHGHVCARCGDIVNRPTPTPTPTPASRSASPQ